MRWTKAPGIYNGAVRTRRAFLLLPRTIENQTRWLERAKWQERAVLVFDGIDGEVFVWEPVCWLGLKARA